MKATRWGLYLALFVILLGLAVPSMAQQSAPLSELVVRLWPEFDNPDVLVILQGTLDPSVSFPAVVSLPLPPDVDEPYVVASAENNGPLNEVQAYDVEPGQDANWVTFETTQPNIWIEYYHGFDNEAALREYTFTWPGGVEIAQFGFEILQPPGIEEIQVTPAAEGQLGEDGQVHYQAEVGQVSPSDVFNIQFSYQPAQAVPGLMEGSGVERLVGLNIRLWPEYDQQAMLVLLEVVLPEDVPLPARVVIPLPGSAGDPHAVAYVTPDGELLNAVYDLDSQGQWTLLGIEAESRELRVEYYDILAMSGQQRSYRYQWPGGMDIAQVNFEVLPPPDAQNVVIQPAAQAGTAASGQTLYSQAVGPLTAQEPLSISVSYQGEQVVFERPEGVTGGTPDINQWLPWVIGGVALILVVGGGWMLIRTRQPAPKSKKRRRRASSKQKAQSPEAALDAAVVFCHVCGSRATASDRFCRQCGAELRT
ncbi:MAG: zinc ribbon domain-containing protein [Anaerolineales bacterium]|jgi:hypothetical protein